MVSPEMFFKLLVKQKIQCLVNENDKRTDVVAL